MARHALYELQNVYVSMQQYAKGIRGHVRVAANISAIAQFVPSEITILTVVSVVHRELARSNLSRDLSNRKVQSVLVTTGHCS